MMHRNTPPNKNAKVMRRPMNEPACNTKEVTWSPITNELPGPPNRAYLVETTWVYFHKSSRHMTIWDSRLGNSAATWNRVPELRVYKKIGPSGESISLIQQPRQWSSSYPDPLQPPLWTSPDWQRSNLEAKQSSTLSNGTPLPWLKCGAAPVLSE